MQKIITRMLKKGNVATGTQTDPIEFLNQDDDLGMSGELIITPNEPSPEKVSGDKKTSE